MSTSGRLSLRRGQRPRGQALVEFALVIPIFLLLFMALFDLGSAVFTYNSLTNAAREGARLAIVNQDEPSIILRAQRAVSIAEINTPSVTVNFYQQAADGTPDTSGSGTCSPVAVGCLAVVSFVATYHPLTPIIGSFIFPNGVDFTAKSVMSVEFSCPNSTTIAANCPKQP
jgi:Flp pilus assembly protein TadG